MVVVAFADAPVKLWVQRKSIRDRLAKVYEVMDNLPFMPQDCNIGRCVHILSHDLCFLKADGQSKALAGLAEAVHELLKDFGWVGGNGCTVGKEEITQTFHLDFELSVWPGPEVDALCCISKCLLQQESERKFQIRLERGRSPISLHFGCQKGLTLSQQRPQCLSCHREGI